MLHTEFDGVILSKKATSVSFDSSLIQEEDLVFGTLRLLETDVRVILPARVHIRILVTSSDVLHS